MMVSSIFRATGGLKKATSIYILDIYIYISRSIYIYALKIFNIMKLLIFNNNYCEEE